MAGLETDTITLSSLARTPASSRSELYEGLPLPRPKSSIRLLHLDRNVHGSSASVEGKLRVVKLDDSPQFVALSYVWKDGEEDNSGDRFIRCNNFELPITKSCHDALTSLRDSCAPMDIWVDSICIDQDNEEEKNLQIEIMTEIYTWAKTVYVWLGPGSIHTDKAIKGLKRASNFRVHYPGVPWTNGKVQRTWRDVYLLVTSTMLCYSLLFLSGLTFGTFGIRQSFKAEDLDELLSRGWIGRAWTYQEIIFASNPIIRTASHEILRQKRK
ncbi:hypothetical protein PFICI_02242 [Pestalotiopsis fici W106-1]|uniref:Heterokaryon incompatibility domain-containing protein n=1 Tax=Pestalotiopsis fici (strain W106-1 / CGMCC3.15140) TaxID=1229662 RepID=W3XFN1_PESFW|nr:uncharacterized protein PFICI_02242 [Pestalotiopsis fici W106-1]ETS84217.1 hypothetical protein PFICI_02242 [Pestalotiopsis fici W106-1]